LALRSFKTLLALLLTGALAVAVLLTFTSMSALRSLGDEAQRVYAAQSLTADILPPPMYLIELRLLASQAREGLIDPSAAHSQARRLRQEYEERAHYWRLQPSFGLSPALYAEQERTAKALLDCIDGEVLPLLAAHDMRRADAALVRAETLYKSHRLSIDETVRAARALAERVRQDFENTRARTRLYSLVSLAVGAAVLVVLFALIQRRLRRPNRPCVSAASSAVPTLRSKRPRLPTAPRVSFSPP
jgi:hypothetical protein